MSDKIEAVLNQIPSIVDFIICIDDCCPDQSGKIIQRHADISRIKVLFHETNQGVGGAMVTGYKAALDLKADIVIKIDGDGQMDPALIPIFISPILEGQCDYTKGNRFFLPEYVQDMPTIRLVGNGILSFLTKLSSGYWDLFDPTNGYTAIHGKVLKNIPLSKLSKTYFFESDMLFRLNIIRAVIQDIPMTSLYADEKSNLKIKKIIIPFIAGHARNLAKRIFYNYFLRDFNIASIELVFGLILFTFGTGFSVISWSRSIQTDIVASAGTVMLGALPLLIGFQMILSFLQFDIQSVPRKILHNVLPDD